MIDNLFTDISEMENYTICPLINSLSDHDAGLIMMSNTDLRLQNYQIQTIKKINKYTIADVGKSVRASSYNSNKLTNQMQQFHKFIT
jgi:hypothetical protein